eukprot:CAMPEP_0196666250 /NCGR_PEP_ID=MMETSP1086-20130531/64407_1 /TAXON_ID=77921 /ORGANISM="Cyanoptyche  gloeocystis , Strain SAG4.97" /LENGTH=74 /DNA_ID=CAMNT_0042003417 /DNA_START=304 /DNA_END=528 /DNA_ORIENTATION=-
MAEEEPPKPVEEQEPEKEKVIYVDDYEPKQRQISQAQRNKLRREVGAPYRDNYFGWIIFVVLVLVLLCYKAGIL